MQTKEVEMDYFKSDVFSLGVTMLHLAKLRLFSSIPLSLKDLQQLKQAVNSEIRGLHYSNDLLNLLGRMLENEPAQRPPIELLFKQRYVGGS